MGCGNADHIIVILLWIYPLDAVWASETSTVMFCLDFLGALAKRAGASGVHRSDKKAKRTTRFICAEASYDDLSPGLYIPKH